MVGLAGYVLAGVIFITYGLWWTFLSGWTRIKSITAGGRRLRLNTDDTTSLKDRSWLPQPFKQNVPLEPLVKLLVSLAGVVYASCQTGDGDGFHVFSIEYDKDGHIVTNLIPLHHIVMCLAFAVSALVDLFSLVVDLPSSASQIFFCLAFAIEGLLLHYQVQATEDLTMYVLLVSEVLALGCAAFALLRVLDGKNFAINTSLAYCILLQGTWFLETGILLFPPDRETWFLSCPEIPMDVQWKGVHDIFHYVKTQMNDTEVAKLCMNLIYDDNTSLVVSGSFGAHVLAVALFILVVSVVMQVLAQKGCCNGFLQNTAGYMGLDSTGVWKQGCEIETLLTDTTDNLVAEEELEAEPENDSVFKKNHHSCQLQTAGDEDQPQCKVHRKVVMETST